MTENNRPDIVAATRGGDSSRGMDGEPTIAAATRDQAIYWRSIYAEILAMEEKVLERIRELMASQSPEARLEVEQTNVPVVVAQVASFRARWEFWDASVRTNQ